MNIYGFAGKPETAKKTRGDQYFFVNNRFIKSAYLNHAVMNAYQEMISKDSFPMYVLFIDLDPAVVDVNVHPTKQEIKFEDEKIIYAFVQAAVKHALAQFSVSPTLDFELDASIQQLPSIQQPFTKEKESAVAATSIFKKFTEKHQAHIIEPSGRSDLKHWKEFYEGEKTQGISNRKEEESFHHSPLPAGVVPGFPVEDITLTQLHSQYILAQTAAGFILIHQQAAHERIIYERLQEAAKGKPVAAQRSMFPVTVELAPADAAIFEELTGELQQLGYTIESFGKNTFIIQGTPADVIQGGEKKVIDSLIEQYKHFNPDLKFSKREKLIRSLAWQQSIKAGRQLDKKEMQNLVNELFQCMHPNISPGGNPVYLEFKKEQLEKQFNR
jgi:DNA mismatch repair protein MutL